LNTSVPDPQFCAHVLEGLVATNKYLSSRYFYDAEGDRLFQAIMGSPEYYPTDCEQQIFEQQGVQIAEALAAGGAFELEELGSGDGLKTQLLLDALHSLDAEFTYRPLDISANSIGLLTDRVCKNRPWLKMDPIHADYMQHLRANQLSASDTQRPRQVVMFLGSNLGNFKHDKAVEFLRLIRGTMRSEDAMLIGLDLQKEPAVIRAAYNDAGGHTRDFNLNLLHRINRELGGNFTVSDFKHAPEYDPETGAACSFLVSTCKQTVHISALQKSFEFAAGEKIFMEISQKYNQPQIESLAAESGFEVQQAFYDSRRWFTDQIWAPVG